MDDLLKKTQQRAYEIYLRRNKQPGRDMEDWLLAEKEVRAELDKSKKPVGAPAAPPAQEKKPAPKITTTIKQTAKRK